MKIKMIPEKNSHLLDITLLKTKDELVTSSMCFVENLSKFPVNNANDPALIAKPQLHISIKLFVEDLASRPFIGS